MKQVLCVIETAEKRFKKLAGWKVNLLLEKKKIKKELGREAYVIF